LLLLVISCCTSVMNMPLHASCKIQWWVKIRWEQHSNGRFMIFLLHNVITAYDQVQWRTRAHFLSKIHHYQTDVPPII
jgi:hypothetical protein